MAKPVIYTWRDDSAPVYLATMASFKALIQACMVDGYGSKPGAGWTIPFEDADSFILKQGGTNPIKHCMKLYDYNASSTQAYMVYDVAVNYTDLNTAVDRWDYYQGDNQNYYKKFMKGYASNTTTYHIPWMIIATTRSVYFFFGYNNTESSQIPSGMSSYQTKTITYRYENFFGDYVPYHDWNDYNTMYALNYTSNTTLSEVSSCVSQTNNARTRKISPTGLQDSRVEPNDLYVNSLVRSNVIYGDYLGVSRASTTSTSNLGILSDYSDNDRSLFLDVIRLTNAHSMVGEMPGALYSLNGRYFSKENQSIISFKGVGGYGGENIYTIDSYYGQFFIHDGEWGVE